MPISRREFDEGRFDLTVPILEYLNVRRDDAFAAEEILTQLTGIFDRQATITEVNQALDGMVQRGMVESREIGMSRWYTISLI